MNAPSESPSALKSNAPHSPDGSEITVVTPASSITPEQYPAGITSRELAHALQGETLGHFVLQEFIGGGGMGVVFKAYDTRLDRTVAVKVVASQRISTKDLERRFIIEAQSAARLDHPNIARVYEVNKARGLSYIVFEHIEGSNLRDYVLQRGMLPLNDALLLTYQIAHALSHATDRDVVHRDIKPSNILVTPEGQTKIVDMGLARLKQVEPADHELTATGMTLGTFDYISPEQARDPRTADARSDIYSLGCTLFYMLAGQAPFSKGTMVEKIMFHQSELPPELRRFRSDIPDSVNALLRSMLAKSPANRPQHPAQLAQRIRAILSDLGSAVSDQLSPVEWHAQFVQPPAWRTHLPWILPVAVLLTAVPLLNGLLSPAAPPVTFLPIVETTASPSPTNPSIKKTDEAVSTAQSAQPVPNPSSADPLPSSTEDSATTSSEIADTATAPEVNLSSVTFRIVADPTEETPTSAIRPGNQSQALGDPVENANGFQWSWEETPPEAN
ncbi:serine/threonine-protein kinase [Adhaeretor mobilis]|uniref:Serine/threonine-protein kinase PrkC n=1 Tax=Adhaeretor mobilis TaxID=1930276 RepID=A0A517MU80_9BACT|nr:serine/threonine-protein kinase [Adhaeretor mobilis]QDS98431.1 Serine/threonine-protein kinase PrkC [Adhaeretor mobilis]